MPACTLSASEVPYLGKDHNKLELKGFISAYSENGPCKNNSQKTEDYRCVLNPHYRSEGGRNTYSAEKESSKDMSYQGSVLDFA